MIRLSKKAFSVGTVRVLAKTFDIGAFYSAFVFFRVNNEPSSPYFYGLLSLKEGDAASDLPYYARISVVNSACEKAALTGIGAGETIEAAILESFSFFIKKAKYLFCVEEEKEAMAQAVARIETALAIKKGDWKEKLQNHGIKVQRYFGKIKK